MQFWERPFALRLPGTSTDLLAAAARVDPDELHDHRGLLHQGKGLEVDVDGSQIVATVWTPGGRGSRSYGPTLRATFEPDSAWTTIRGELSWWRLATAFAFAPLIVGAIVALIFWGMAHRPGTETFGHWMMLAPGAIAVLAIRSVFLLPRRMARDETVMKEALQRDLSFTD